MSERLEWITIGVVTRAHGVRGEVRVKPLTDFPERFETTESVSAWIDGVRKHFEVEGVRAHGDGYLLKLAGVDDRDAAEALRRVEFQVSRDQLVPLPDDEYYIFDLVGATVTTEAGVQLGTLVDVLQTGANDVYVVRDASRKEVLIPAIRSVVRRIDLEERLIVIDPLPGLLE